MKTLHEKGMMWIICREKAARALVGVTECLSIDTKGSEAKDAKLS